MNIGIYGNSIAVWKNKQDFSYITKLQNHYQANIVNSGSVCASEERILFELKKTKNLDIAIIFHSDPFFIFIPGWWRDVNTLDQKTLLKKFELIESLQIEELSKIPELLEITNDSAVMVDVPNDSNHVAGFLKFMQTVPDGSLYNLVNSFIRPSGGDLFNHETREEWCQGGDEALKNILGRYSNKKVHSELLDALILFKKYMYHYDLQQNRYYGALIQIDQYCFAKNIKVIHCLGKPSWYPNWFKFSSGLIDRELGLLQKSQYYDRYSKSDNGVNEEGNSIMFNRIVELIDQCGL